MIRRISWHVCPRAVLILIAIVAAAAFATRAPAQNAEAFTHASVQRIAQDLAAKAYVAPAGALPQGLDKLDYDQYRQLRFRPDRSLWRSEALGFEMQLLPVGWLFKAPIEINIVENGQAKTIAPDNSYFEMGPLEGKLAPETRMGFSGFRINGPLNRPDKSDEIVVFQGASYFRALGRGQIYGASGRGLALNVAKPDGEEFPHFRRFWIEKPAKGAPSIIIHALLDSPSVAGAYKFTVSPGLPTVMDVEATLYPRLELATVGLSPLTSMFLFSSIERSRISDFRPSVHDSDGLAVLNGWGERLWRPLNNPRRLQVSSFLDRAPKGFGLIQRSRAFADFQDLEARYDRRPSVWVETKGDWGSGAVELVEIPTEEEIHDNIVAYWRPAQPLPVGRPHAFAYRLLWTDDVPISWPGAIVRKTSAGLVNGPQRQSGARQFVVDFTGPALSKDTEMPSASVETSAGAVSSPVVQRNPEMGGVRASFVLDPKGAASAELRLTLHVNNQAISEAWLYRWTKE